MPCARSHPPPPHTHTQTHTVCAQRTCSVREYDSGVFDFAVDSSGITLGPLLPTSVVRGTSPCEASDSRRLVLVDARNASRVSSPCTSCRVRATSASVKRPSMRWHACMSSMKLPVVICSPSGVAENVLYMACKRRENLSRRHHVSTSVTVHMDTHAQTHTVQQPTSRTCQ